MGPGVFENIIDTITGGLVSPEQAGEALRGFAASIQPALDGIRDVLNIPRW